MINPGEPIQQAVDRNPEGTAFIIKSGVHRLQQVIPKNGNTFTGEPGAIMNGANLLQSFTKSGHYWVASGQTQQGPVHGVCLLNPDGRTRYEGCRYAEDLFMDDVPLWHVTTLGEVGPGKWHFDYAADKIYLADNPSGRKVEVSVTRYAFGGRAQHVTIRGLIIEKYAVPAQFGAINGADASDVLSTAWLIQHCEVRLNHGRGIHTGHQMHILNNFVHHNGQLGIGGLGDNILVEGNEIAYNNYAGFAADWEAGGSKWVKTRHLVVRGNYSHHNKGPGLWTDIDNIYTLYEHNRVVANMEAGIFHEISYDVVIRNNTAQKNGQRLDPWLYGAQILISNSRNAQVYKNTVEVDATTGNGIALIQQNRGTGAYGPYITIGNAVYDNVIVYLGNHGLSGATADHDPEVMLHGNNRFDANHYHVLRLDKRWIWGEPKDWQGFKGTGQESYGSADIHVSGLPAPTELRILSPSP